MSIWYEIADQEDVELSEDGRTIDVLVSSDDFGNNYVMIPIEFIKHCIKEQANGNTKNV